MKAPSSIVSGTDPHLLEDVVLVSPRHYVWIARGLFFTFVTSIVLVMMAHYQESKPASGYLQLSGGTGKIYSPARGTLAELHVSLGKNKGVKYNIDYL